MFPRPDGEEWRKDDWDNWRNRVFRPALRAIGLPATIRPYDLRGYQLPTGRPDLVLRGAPLAVAELGVRF